MQIVSHKSEPFWQDHIDNKNCLLSEIIELVWNSLGQGTYCLMSCCPFCQRETQLNKPFPWQVSMLKNTDEVKIGKYTWGGYSTFPTTLNFALSSKTYFWKLLDIHPYVNTCAIQVSWRNEAQTVSKIQVQNVFCESGEVHSIKMYNSLLMFISHLFRKYYP